MVEDKERIFMDKKIYDFDKALDRKKLDSIKTHAPSKAHEKSIPAWIADMDFVSAEPIRDALTKRMGEPSYGYTYADNSFYESISYWYSKRHDFAIKNDWIVPSIGIVHQMRFVYEVFANKGDKVLIMPPLYPPFRHMVRASGGDIVESELILKEDGYKIDFSDLEEKLKEKDIKFLYFCNPHNPVGRVWSKDELKKVADFCKKYGVMIFSDEVHGDLAFADKPYTPMAKLAPDITITATAPNKAFNIAGIGGSISIIPNKDIREKFENYLAKRNLGQLHIPQIVAFKAACKYGENWLDQVLSYIRENKEWVENYFNKNIKNVKVIPSEGTYLLWLDFRRLGMDDKKLDKFLLEDAKVWLNSGYTFGKAGSGFMRLNIATQRENIEKIAKRIEKAVNSL